MTEPKRKVLRGRIYYSLILEKQEGGSVLLTAADPRGEAGDIYIEVDRADLFAAVREVCGD